MQRSLALVHSFDSCIDSPALMRVKTLRPQAHAAGPFVATFLVSSLESNDRRFTVSVIFFRCALALIVPE